MLAICLPVILFPIVNFYQLSLKNWALGTIAMWVLLILEYESLESPEIYSSL